MRRGFLLVEVSLTYIILALALVALLPVFILSVRSAKNLEQIAVSSHLAAGLMEEVRLRKWDRGTPVPPVRIAAPAPLGPDSGESAADKRTFDDIDDFDGWKESPPRDPLMNPMPEFAAYTRTVAVGYVTPALAASSAATDLKRVTVCAGTLKLKPVCMDTVLTNR